MVRTLVSSTSSGGQIFSSHAEAVKYASGGGGRVTTPSASQQQAIERGRAAEKEQAFQEKVAGVPVGERAQPLWSATTIKGVEDLSGQLRKQLNLPYTATETQVRQELLRLGLKTSPATQQELLKQISQTQAQQKISERQKAEQRLTALGVLKQEPTLPFKSTIEFVKPSIMTKAGREYYTAQEGIKQTISKVPEYLRQPIWTMQKYDFTGLSGLYPTKEQYLWATEEPVFMRQEYGKQLIREAQYPLPDYTKDIFEKQIKEKKEFEETYGKKYLGFDFGKFHEKLYTGFLQPSLKWVGGKTGLRKEMIAGEGAKISQILFPYGSQKGKEKFFTEEYISLTQKPLTYAPEAVSLYFTGGAYKFISLLPYYTKSKWAIRAATGAKGLMYGAGAVYVGGKGFQYYLTPEEKRPKFLAETTLELGAMGLGAYAGVKTVTGVQRLLPTYRVPVKPIPDIYTAKGKVKQQELLTMKEEPTVIMQEYKGRLYGAKYTQKVIQVGKSVYSIMSMGSVRTVSTKIPKQDIFGRVSFDTSLGTYQPKLFNRVISQIPVVKNIAYKLISPLRPLEKMPLSYRIGFGREYKSFGEKPFYKYDFEKEGMFWLSLKHGTKRRITKAEMRKPPEARYKTYKPFREGYLFKKGKQRVFIRPEFATIGGRQIVAGTTKVAYEKGLRKPFIRVERELYKPQFQRTEALIQKNIPKLLITKEGMQEIPTGRKAFARPASQVVSPQLLTLQKQISFLQKKQPSITQPKEKEFFMQKPELVLKQELKQITPELKQPELKEQKQVEKVYGGFRYGIKEKLFAKLEKQREALRAKRLPVIIQKGMTTQKKELKKIKKEIETLSKQEFVQPTYEKSEFGKSRFEDLSGRTKEYPLIEPEYIYVGKRRAGIGYVPKISSPEIIDIKGKVTPIIKEKYLQSLRPSVALRTDILQRQGLLLKPSQQQSQLQKQVQSQMQMQQQMQKQMQSQLQKQIQEQMQKEKGLLIPMFEKPSITKTELRIPAIPKYIKPRPPEQPSYRRQPEKPPQPPKLEIIKFKIPKFQADISFAKGRARPRFRFPRFKKQRKPSEQFFPYSDPISLLKTELRTRRRAIQSRITPKSIREYGQALRGERWFIPTIR